VVERARWLWMLLWTHGARLSRIRREIQIIARRDDADSRLRES